MIHPMIRECLATHELFRKMGYEPEDIFVSIPPDKSFGVTVKVGPGKDDFATVRISRDAQNYLSPERIVEEWEEARKYWNGLMPDEEMDHIYNTSMARERSAQILEAILALGFDPPMYNKIRHKQFLKTLEVN